MTRPAPALTPTDLAHFEREGWVLLRGCAAADEVAALRAEEERFRLDVGYGGAKNASLRVNIQLCHRSRVVREFCTRGAHIEALTDLIGPDVCLTHQQFVTKLPDEGEQRSDIPFHQDQGYGRIEPDDDVTIWLPLVDADESNGGLFVVPGSHRRGLLPHTSAKVNPVLIEVDADEAVALEVGAGDAVAFSGLLIHGSGPNRSGAERPVMYTRYCRANARMFVPREQWVLEDAHSWMVAGEARDL